ncbi:MAG TPA: class I SAM-dependent methyltransferase [Caulobacteraceae bacterium]|jgi:SAM-dependent methyltransferase
MSIEQNKLDFFIPRMLGDMGAAAMVPLIRIGDELGLYRALKDAGPLTSAELAARTGTAERYIREWLAAHAASEYLDYDAASETFVMTPEQAMVFADEGGPLFMLGAFEMYAANARDYPKLVSAFRTGEGVGWHQHDRCLFSGVERFFRSGYEYHLVPEWLPALDGVVDKLRAGASVADVGCGHGASTLIMARAFPNSLFAGFDYHPESIERARAAAEEAGLWNVSFNVASAKDFPGEGYDLIAFFDCLHDMGDPVGAARHARQALAPGGTAMLVEPLAGDTLAENLNPVGRLYYAASTVICTPASLSQEVGLGLGAQAGPKRLSKVLADGGFADVRVAVKTPFNLVVEARV